MDVPSDGPSLHLTGDTKLLTRCSIRSAGVDVGSDGPGQATPDVGVTGSQHLAGDTTLLTRCSIRSAGVDV